MKIEAMRWWAGAFFTTEATSLSSNAALKHSVRSPLQLVSLSLQHKHTFPMFSFPCKSGQAEGLKKELEAWDFLRHDDTVCLYCCGDYPPHCCCETEQLACEEIGVLVYLKTKTFTLFMPLSSVKCTNTFWLCNTAFEKGNGYRRAPTVISPSVLCYIKYTLFRHVRKYF